MALTREQILQSADLPRESVEVVEWGGTVWVSRLSGLHRAELDDCTRELLDTDGKFTHLGSLRYAMELIVRAVVDEQGQHLFTSDDIPRLQRKSANALGRVGEVALRVNGIGVKAEEEAKKNLLLNGVSHSSLPEPLAG